MRLITFLLTLIMAASVWADNVGTTVFTRGKVIANSGEAQRELSRRAPIFSDDKVSTGEHARAVLKLVDDTVITLGENAAFQLQEFAFNDTEKKAVINIPVGAFRVITGKLTKVEDPQFTVVTPRSNIGVRGTDFWGGSLHEGAIDIALLEGEHVLVVSNEFGSVEINTPGFGTTVYEGQAPSEPVLWPEDMVAKAVATISY